MAELTDVVVEYHNEVTINVGNFENVKPGYRVSGTLAGKATKADLEDARAKLQAVVDGWLEADVEKIREELKNG